MSWREVLTCEKDQKPLTKVTEAHKETEQIEKQPLVSLLSALSSPPGNGFSDREPVGQAQTRQVLNRAGCRLMRLETGFTVGVWSDLDSPQIRAALHVLALDRLPIAYLDGDVPEKFKTRKVAGESVPPNGNRCRTVGSPRHDARGDGLATERGSGFACLNQS
jgi:hypothetical protein